MSAFERWWYDEGSGMRPLPEEDAEAHVRRICEIAWSNGAYKAREEMEAKPYVYEVIDRSDDEQYYPLGIFLDRESALKVLDADKPPLNDGDLDYVTHEVRIRPVGFNPYAERAIATRSWERKYDEADDDIGWKAHPIKFPAAPGSNLEP